MLIITKRLERWIFSTSEPYIEDFFRPACRDPPQPPCYGSTFRVPLDLCSLPSQLLLVDYVIVHRRNLPYYELGSVNASALQFVYNNSTLPFFLLPFLYKYRYYGFLIHSTRSWQSTSWSWKAVLRPIMPPRRLSTFQMLSLWTFFLPGPFQGRCSQVSEIWQEQI